MTTTRERDVSRASRSVSRRAVGDEEVGSDGSVGEIAGLLEIERAVPRPAVIATGRCPRSYPAITCGLITHSDDAIVRVRGSRCTLVRLGESVPPAA